MHQPTAEESRESIDMINQAQAIPDYISEGPEPEHDIEEQWGQLAIYEIHISPEDLKAHPDYISAETDYHLQPPIFNKQQLRHIYPECFCGIG